MDHRIRRCAAALIVAGVTAGCTAETATAPAFEVAASVVSNVATVMHGLNSPRGLAWGPDGALYVVEAGEAVIRGPCTVVPRGLNCYSGTGAVSRLWKGRQERVATGLPSAFNPVISDIIGVHDIAFVGLGAAWVTVGWAGPPAARGGLGAAGSALGSLIKIEPSGQWRVWADVSAHESAYNPDGGAVDSNPYGLLAEPGGLFVTDAGGNDLLQVLPNGSVSHVATFAPTAAPPPFLQAEAVPTAVERGPDGALYVSMLTGVPFLAGAAAIYRVVPGSPPQMHEGGFKTITDFTWGPDGSLYVLEYASSPVFFGGPGRLIRVAPGGSRTIVTTALANPTSVAAGPDGAIYVSNKGNLAGVGEVLRITL